MFLKSLVTLLGAAVAVQSLPAGESANELGMSRFNLLMKLINLFSQKKSRQMPGSSDSNM